MGFFWTSAFLYLSISRTFFPLAIFKQLHRFKCRAAADQLVAEVRLVRLAIVDLVTLLAGFVYIEEERDVSITSNI